MMKRERNQKKLAKMHSGGKSQLKTNEAAKNIKCKICLQTFLCTANPADLKLHSDNKHPKLKFEDCFDVPAPGQ